MTDTTANTVQTAHTTGSARQYPRQDPYMVKHFLYGAAYYDEYTPKSHDITQDMRLMREAGMNVIRIGESTWATEEPHPGVFDFSSLERTVAAAAHESISVIVGTPTYAVPSWLVELDPHVLAVSARGENHYGPRQNIDIVNGTYRFYAERIIRRMAWWAAEKPNIIGFQIDNETKYYDSYSPDMQSLFVESLRQRFNGDLDALNEEFGLNYWSNRISSWRDFPDMRGCVNQSLRSAFDRFRRHQVAEFLLWQRRIIESECRPDQFLTHNFDYSWELGFSSGLQSGADHFEEARAVTLTGTDIYHPSEDHLTGREIVLMGDLARAVKGQSGHGQNGDGRSNYIVLETEAQGQTGWLPYPGQLRLQGYAHMANGADGVEYWHWATTHNGLETYWRGLLSQDYRPNRTYEEAKKFGTEVAGLDGRLLHLTKRNKVAILVSNDSMTAVDGWFNIDDGTPERLRDGTRKLTYNAVLRQISAAFYDLNIETDILPPSASSADFARYSLVVTPTLYCADDGLITRLRDYVSAGGHLLATPRSFFCDPDARVWADDQPHGLTDVFGLRYSQFTRIAASASDHAGCRGVRVAMNAIPDSPQITVARHMMELLIPFDQKDVLASYDHYAFNEYAAIVRHRFGSGDGEWVGTFFDDDACAAIVREAAAHAGVLSAYSDLVGRVHVLEGTTGRGEHVIYLFNFSADPVTVPVPVAGQILVGDGGVNVSATDVNDEMTRDTAGRRVTIGEKITIPRWNLSVIAAD